MALKSSRGTPTAAAIREFWRDAGALRASRGEGEGEGGREEGGEGGRGREGRREGRREGEREGEREGGREGEGEGERDDSWAHASPSASGRAMRKHHRRAATAARNSGPVWFRVGGTGPARSAEGPRTRGGRNQRGRQTAISGSRMPAGFMRLVLNSSQIKGRLRYSSWEEGGKGGRGSLVVPELCVHADCNLHVREDMPSQEP